MKRFSCSAVIVGFEQVFSHSVGLIPLRSKLEKQFFITIIVGNSLRCAIAMNTFAIKTDRKHIYDGAVKLSSKCFLFQTHNLFLDIQRFFLMLLQEILINRKSSCFKFLTMSQQIYCRCSFFDF